MFAEWSLVHILLNYIKCLRGQSPNIMGLHNSIMKLHNSIYGAQLQSMQLYMNYGTPSSLEVHEWSCIKIELHGVSQFKSPLNYHLMCMGWVELFLNWLHIEVYADHAALKLQD